MTDADETRYVERTDTGVSLTVELKRGTGTRDQDKVVAKVKGENFAAVREEYEDNREWLREQAHDVRTWQPDADGESE